MNNIIFIDDEQDYLDDLQSCFNNKLKHEFPVNVDFIHQTSDLDIQSFVHKYSSFIVDLKLENDSGINVLQEIRNISKNTKLILLTGKFISLEEQKKCKELDAEFIFKNLDDEILLRNVLNISTTKDFINKVKHVFISYVHDDIIPVMEIVKKLEENNLNVWLDKHNIEPGSDWQIAIKNAIEDGMYFIAFFSENYWNKTKQKTYMNEELQIAIEQMRKMADDTVWFIPVKLTDCKIPKFHIRANKSLDSKQYLPLYENWESSIDNLIRTLRK